MVSTAATEELLATEPALYELTSDQFSEMIEAGIIPEDRRISLINGRLYEEMGKSKPHGSVGGRLNMVLAELLIRLNATQPDAAAWILCPEGTMILSRTDAPMPDFAVVRDTGNLLSVSADRYPGPQDIGLIIELSVSSLDFDLTTKLERYALSGILIYWVVDIVGDRIVVHTEPAVEGSRGVYRRVDTYGLEQSVPLLLDGFELGMIPVSSVIRR